MAFLAVAVIVAVLIADGDHLAQALVIVVGLALMLLATRSAFKIHVPPALARIAVRGTPKRSGSSSR